MVGEETEGGVEDGEDRVEEEGAGVESVLGWTQSFCIENGTLLLGIRSMGRMRQKLESAQG